MSNYTLWQPRLLKQRAFPSDGILWVATAKNKYIFINNDLHYDDQSLGIKIKTICVNNPITMSECWLHFCWLIIMKLFNLNQCIINQLLILSVFTISALLLYICLSKHCLTTKNLFWILLLTILFTVQHIVRVYMKFPSQGKRTE